MTNDLTLQKVAQAILDKHQVSGRELSRRAENKGFVLSYTTVNGIAAGTYQSRPTEKTLRAFAALSDCSLAEVYAAAGLPMPRRPLAEDLPADADTLTPDQRRAVLAVVRQFANANKALAQLERQEQADGSQAQGTPITQAAGSAATENEAPVPPTAVEYGLAANHAPRERAFDDQSETNE